MASIVSLPGGPLAGVLVGPAALMPQDFLIRRGYEGPQVIIQWGDPLEPASVDSIRLVRRRFGYPIDPNDGVIIYDGPTGPVKLSDVDVEACICYFYKIFVFAKNGDVLVNQDTEGSIIPIETGFFGIKLWDLLPELYKLNDKGLGEAISPKKTLTEGAAAGDVEIYNFGEDGTFPYGPLRRLLRLYGPILDEAKGLIDCFPNQLDVDDSCIPELEGLSALLGLTLNKELTPEQFRNEVRVQVANLKLKGTIPGIQARLRSVSGLDAIIAEQCHLALIANDPERTSLTFDADDIANINTENDNIHRSVGFYDNIRPFWLWYNAYLDVDINTFDLNESLARKWCLAIDDSSPACHKGFLFIRTALDSDTIPFTFVDEFSDGVLFQDDELMVIGLIEVWFDEYVSNSSKWMIFNEETDLFNTADYTAVFATPTLP